MNTTLNPEKTEKMKKPFEGKDGFAHDFAKNVKSYSEDAVEAISDGYGTALAWVKKNPLQAAAIGAGVGFLIGAAIRKFGGKKE